jgi:GntR family transcriptional regulator
MNPASSQIVDDQLKSPRYMQVYSAVRQWIMQGHYGPGMQLEPESRLCEMFGVSRITVRKAIELLAAEGLVSSQRGKGTFISTENIRLPVRADMDQRIRKSRALAGNSKLQQLRIKTVQAGPEISTDLRLKPGADVIFSSYVRVLRGAPVGYVESYIATATGISLTASDFRTSTMLTILEDKGIQLSGIDHLIGATLSDTRLASLLDTQVGAPLVTVKMVMHDGKLQPVERVYAWFLADQYEHHMFLARGQTEPMPGNAPEARGVSQ